MNYFAPRLRKHHRRCRRAATVVAIDLLEPRTLLSVTTATLGPSQDSSIYNIFSGDLSNGAGEAIVVGGSRDGIAARRGLVAFDLSAAGVPDGATILDAVLTMHVAVSTATADVSLHAVTTPWSESGSDAPGNEFNGAAAQVRDATWQFALFGSLHWNSAGGDYASVTDVAQAAPSGVIQWSGNALIDDVQLWLDDPSLNYGWMLITDEQSDAVQSFVSKDSANVALHPQLEITWEDPWLPAVVEGRKWYDKNADGIHQQSQLTDLKLVWSQGRSYFNSFNGNEYWYWSQATSGWYFMTPDGSLVQWDRTNKKLSGTTVATPGPRAWYSPESLLLAAAVGNSEPWLNGFTFELVNSAGQVIAESTSADRDLNQDGVIQPETERGWYRFENVPPGNYRVRERLSDGWTQTAGRFAPLAESAWRLSEDLGLNFTGNLHQNFGGLGEKWLLGSAGWYFMTPDGRLSLWNRQAVTPLKPLQGTLTATLTNEYYRDVSLIYGAEQPLLVVTSGSVHSGINFGNYRTIQIAGRIWNEIDPNGLRNAPELQNYQLVAVPTGVPESLAGFRWYMVPAPGEPQYYCISSIGEVFSWSLQKGPRLHTRISEAAAGNEQTIREAAFSAEQWLNNVTVELLDEAGHVIASRVTADSDLNLDQQVQPETESGWYRFSGLLPGKYTLRQILSVGTIDVSQPAPQENAQLQTLAQQFGFISTSRDHFNFGGLNERWFRDRDNRWYFITPDGRIRRWNGISGGINGTAKGIEVARVASRYFVNLSLLTTPPATLHTVADAAAITVNLGQSRILDTIFADLASELT